MPQTYRAILENNQLRWIDEMPESIPQHQPLNVLVMIPEEPSLEERHLRSAKVAGILERLAARNGLEEIADPVSWQRESREDRSLPGRE